MSTLKDKFDNYNPQPDPQVWQEINTTLLKLRARRRWIVASSVMAVGVGAAALFFALNNSQTSPVAAETGTVVASENTATPVVPQIVVADEQESPVIAAQEQSMLPAFSCDFLPSDDQTAEMVVSENDNNDVAQQEVAVLSQTQQEVTSLSSESESHVVVSAPTSPVQVVEAETVPAENKQAQEPQRRITQRSSPSELVVWIPNAFSPDDPVEESARIFKVFPNNDASIISFEIFIYSRTGRLVYHSKDYNEGWDGTANGKKQPMGTYVYIIEINDSAKGLQHTKGSITLLR